MLIRIGQRIVWIDVFVLPCCYWIINHLIYITLIFIHIYLYISVDWCTVICLKNKGWVKSHKTTFNFQKKGKWHIWIPQQLVVACLLVYVKKMKVVPKNTLLDQNKCVLWQNRSEIVTKKITRYILNSGTLYSTTRLLLYFHRMYILKICVS